MTSQITQLLAPVATPTTIATAGTAIASVTSTGTITTTIIIITTTTITTAALAAATVAAAATTTTTVATAVTSCPLVKGAVNIVLTSFAISTESKIRNSKISVTIVHK